jgi:hypothetical protein
MIRGSRSGLAVLAVAVVATLDLRIALRGDLDPIPDEAFAAALSEIDRMRRPGDQIVHSPLFTVSELARLGALSAKPDRPPDRLMETRRVLVLDRADHPMYLPGSPSEVVPIGDLELRIYERTSGGEVSTFDLYEQLTERTMRVERDGRITSACTRRRSEGGYECPGEAEWLYVAQRTIRIASQDSPCLWAHPTTGGTIVFEVPPQEAPPEGRILELTVSAAMADDAVDGTPGGAAVLTEIRQSGALLATVTVPNQVGWFEAKVPIAAAAPVELRITTVRDGRRHHCLNARIVERAQ